MCLSSRLWGDLGSWFPVYHPDFIIVWSPQLWHYVSVSQCFSWHLLSRAHCHGAQYFPTISACLAEQVLSTAGWRNKSVTRSCASHTCVTWSANSVFLSFLYIMHFELGVEVDFYNGSAVANNKADLLKYLRQSSCSVRTDDTFVLLICFCFFHL